MTLKRRRDKSGGEGTSRKRLTVSLVRKGLIEDISSCNTIEERRLLKKSYLRETLSHQLNR